MADKRIIFLVNNLGMGGAEKQLFNIIKGLKRLRCGYDFTIITLYDGGGYEEPFKSLAIPVYHMDIKGSLFSPSNGIKCCKLLRLINFVDPDIINSWSFHTNLINVVFSLFLTKPKIITSKYSSNCWYRKKHFLANRVVYKKSDMIMVNANALRNEILKYNLVPNKIRCIPNGIDTRIRIDEIVVSSSIEQIKNSGMIIIGSVARFVSEKRYEDVIEAARLVVKKFEKSHFIFVGGRGKIDEYKLLVKNLNLGDRITFTDEVEDVLPYIKGFDIFLMASSSEGMPNALMEAMLMGKPVVATKVGAIPDLIEEGINGLLVPPFRPDLLAESLVKLICNRELQRYFASNNLYKIKELSLENMASKVEELYQEALSK